MPKIKETDVLRQHGFLAEAARRGVSWRKVLSAVAVAGLLSMGSLSWRQPHAATITAAELAHGRAMCVANGQRPTVDYSLATRRLQELETPGSESLACTVLHNTTLINGDGAVSPGVDIVFRSGVFTAIEDTGSTAAAMAAANCFTIDVAGRYVTPGLVDMHSHVGMRQEPQLWANEDVTESLEPATPWARAIDAFKATDAALQILASGGTTTSLVLTGAMNLMSGEGFVIKHRAHVDGTDFRANTVDSTSGGHSAKPQRHLKMACGENIKSRFEKLGKTPITRLGASGLVRFWFEEAAALRDAQDRWCAAAAGPSGRSLVDPYPASLRLQTLVDVLRGDLRVHVHCYQPQDVLAHYRHADMFGYNITALHHITEAHELLDEISRRGTLLAAFSDEGGFKNENYRYSWYMLRRAADAGIPLALTSDHPAKHGQFLAYEAQIAHHFQIDEKHAMAAVLSVPAGALGLDNRIGWVRPGYDADLVVWDAHPLSLGATPLQVTVDGVTAINASATLWTRSASLPNALAPPPPSRVQMTNSAENCTPGQTDIVLRGIRESFLDGLEDLDSTAPSTAVVRGGVLQCLGADDSCEDLATEAVRDGVSVLQLRDGHVLPGIVAATRSHGLTEMVQEPSTHDGFLSGESIQQVVTAADGLQFGDHHLDFNHRRGITAVVTAPESKGFLHGISTVFRPGAAHALDTGAIVKREAGLLVSLGNEGKSAAYPTISSQFDQLRRLLTTAFTPDEAYARVASGELPLIVRTDNKDIIAKTIALRADVPHLRPVIFGGGEAYLLATELAAANIPVILAPPHCSQLTWEVRNCLPGPPLVDHGGPDLLALANVTLGLGGWDHRDRWIPNLLWEAAWLTRSRTDLPLSQRRAAAVRMVTANMRVIFGLPRHDDAEFVVYEGDPLEFGASVALVVEQGAVQRCWPDVE